MKFFSIVTLIFVVFTSVVFAEDDTLLVEYYACYPFSEDFETTVATFLDNTQQYLEDTEIVVNFETVSVLTCAVNIPFADARLIFYEDIENNKVTDQMVNISLAPYNLHHISPLLQNERAFSISLAQDNAPQLLASFLLYQAGQTEIAKENLQTLQDKIGNIRTVNEINYYLGNIALLEGNIQEALEHYETWLSDTPFHSINYAWVLVQVDDAEKAINHLTEIVKLSNGLPSYPIWLRNRAHIYALAFDYTSAIDDMNTAIDFVESEDFDEVLYMSIYIEPKGISGLLSKLYKERGDIIMLIYEWNRALEDYNTAIELDPDYAEAYYRRGILLYTMVEREDAIADFETYLDMEPEGEFAESAQEYINSIQIELDALSG